MKGNFVFFCLFFVFEDENRVQVHFEYVFHTKEYNNFSSPVTFVGSRCAQTKEVQKKKL